MFPLHAPKICYGLYIGKLRSLFIFIVLVYVDIEKGIHKIEMLSGTKGKRKKTFMSFLKYTKHSKLRSVSLEHFVELKPVFSEECR